MPAPLSCLLLLPSTQAFCSEISRDLRITYLYAVIQSKSLHHCCAWPQRTYAGMEIRVNSVSILQPEKKDTVTHPGHTKRVAGAGLEGHSPQLLSCCGPEVPFSSLTRYTSVLDPQLEHQEGLKYKLIPKSHGLPNHCQSSSIFQSGLDRSQWLHGQRLCIAIYRSAKPPTFPWHQQLLPQGRFCRFPQNGAVFRSSPGCLHCGNPDGYFSFFAQSGPARLRG